MSRPNAITGFYYCGTHGHEQTVPCPECPVTTDEFVAELSHSPQPFEVPYAAMNKPQTLDDFVAEMRKDIDTFEANWRRQHAENPKHWPMELGGGDWYEQFMMFESSGDKS